MSMRTVIYKYCFLLLVFFCNQELKAQFEQGGIRMTGSELETDLLADTSATYLKLMFCGDIMHNKDLYQSHAHPLSSASYRTWFRQVKPLFFFSDIVVCHLKTMFPGNTQFINYGYAAPDEFLGEVNFSGFNVMMMANSMALANREVVTKKSIAKIDKLGLYRVGQYLDSIDRKKNYPLVLEKKDIRIAFLNYSLDSLLFQYPSDQVNFFTMDQFKQDMKKAQEMLVDYTVLYMDWGVQDSIKLEIEVELLNSGVNIIIGSGANGFTTADLLSYTENDKKLLVDNIGHFNAVSFERENNKSALIEVVLKKKLKTNKVTLYDIGFIPTWTLKDAERYAVLPSTNIEEKHIKDINLNLLKYSAMKTALTDMRYAFFDKIPELHYDYTDRNVLAVEQSSFLRKTLLSEQHKYNENFRRKSDSLYREQFGVDPPSAGHFAIPFDDILQIYTNSNVTKKMAIDPLDYLFKKDTTGDVLSDNKILNVKANRKFYTREKDTSTPLTREQLRKIDSINKYNARFLIVDSVDIIKKAIKRKKLEDKRIKDSIYREAQKQIVYNPNRKDVLEAENNYNPYKEVRKTGVFTSPEPNAKKDDLSPVKEIEEYFFVEVMALPTFQNLNTDVMPYLAGYEVRFEDNKYHFLIGRTRSPKLAIEVGRSIKRHGHTDAIVVKYTDGVKSVYRANL